MNVLRGRKEKKTIEREKKKLSAANYVRFHGLITFYLQIRRATVKRRRIPQIENVRNPRLFLYNNRQACLPAAMRQGQKVGPAIIHFVELFAYEAHYRTQQQQRKQFEWETNFHFQILIKFVWENH